MTICCELTLYKIPNIHFVCAGVVGNLPEVGSWDLKKVIRSHTSSDGLLHVRVNLPEETRLEYKWVLFDGATTWMWEPGANKVVDLPRYGSCFIMNQWDGPAVVDTQVPEMTTANKRSSRAEREWKVGTPGTVYKNPDHVTTEIPTGNVHVLSGAKIPFGENYIRKPPQPSQVIESGKVRQLVDKYDIPGSKNDALYKILTPKNRVTTGKSVCAGTGSSSCADTKNACCTDTGNSCCATTGSSCCATTGNSCCTGTGNSCCTTTGNSCCTGANEAGVSSTSTTECRCRPNINRSVPEIMNCVRTIGTSCYSRLSSISTEISSDPNYTMLAAGTGLVCLLIFGTYKATTH